MSTNARPPGTPPALTVRYDPGRATRQLIGFGAATLIMIGLAALGVWMIVASFLQMEAAGIFIGVAFGIFFILVALASLVSCAEVLTRIIRWSRQTAPLLSIDSVGITGLVLVGSRGAGNSDDPIAWGDIRSIRLEGRAPQARRSSGLANLDSGHQLGLVTKKGLDRTAGLRLGMRDGTRRILVELTDGRNAHLNLTLPVSPETFTGIAPQIAEYVRVHNPGILLSDGAGPM
ncbi:hypothetical protein CQ020_08045 [Arthrobacter sp. MYb23]|uniref:hypothetical protein n=1 Tax=unclassified Arthrobacter TaxID=235627 RepID=UPI000CFCED69|nr:MULTISPECIES: hypothetical protein [unclassified Arthrobacter]PRB43409.1 hypothetical protein CQ038_07175 [Arthrobacter sp. MYb51]PRB96933.1 hypothetical protein CQ020_08045 [Arthrobacter sp. MYb23]